MHIHTTLIMRWFGKYAMYACLFIGAYLIIAKATALMIEHKMVYYPNKVATLDPRMHQLPMMERLQLEVNSKVNVTLWVHQPEPGEAVMVYFHGNGGHLGYRNRKFRRLINQGYGLVALSYRGYGDSTGTPSEQGLYDDAAATVEHLLKLGFRQEQLILYGESLGTGVAVHTALSYPNLKAIILEAPYTSLVDLGQRMLPFFPVSLIATERFETDSKITKLNIPLLLFHGEQDRVVPVSHGRALFNMANEPKQAHFIKGTAHTNFNLDELVEHIADWHAIQLAP